MSVLQRLALPIGLTLALLAAPAARAQAPDSEAALRDQLQQATWPADIVAAAERYLQRYPQSPLAGQARQWRAQAELGARVLAERDVRLYRSAFQPEAAAPDARDDLRRAALGDRAAAVRLAHEARRDTPRYLGWLQYAAQLGDERASYELALHYRRAAQPVLAAVYEARAVELGFVPPRDLDHVRK
ncbi:MAG: hypothetical protein KIT35_02830 [Piscinibacter sp.]|uniref:hypothetical protein n=1 Tax=Piscinibacter sp. TaxID=1903157 RepID=UPI00258A8F4C|nr:hypothetical protein [Piscinibacter sp.]MCW5662747.1 hypothetical protein [Piscinibacter sp.]